MLDQWVKITTIAAASVLIVSAIIGATVGGIIWLVRLDNDVRQLQTDVRQLQADVAQLQTDVSQMQLDIKQIQDNQQIIIEILRELSVDVQKSEADLLGHTHDPDGRARLPLTTTR